jgi:ribosomal protein S18 acetylase RimI-like enzyme
VDPLDNIMWHSLGGPHHLFAEGDERARRYPPDVGPFSAVPDEPLPEHFAALRDLVGPGDVAILFRGDVKVPDDWEVLGTINGVRMIWLSGPPLDGADPRIVTLGDEDVDEMMSLTARTKPGPFAPRTVALGMYMGIRLDGHLIAMAGQRARTNGHVEISAVCTDEHHVGQGLGRALMNAQVGVILAEGRIPMLHTSASNARAIALYEFFGFQHRRSVSGVIMRSPLSASA